MKTYHLVPTTYHKLSLTTLSYCYYYRRKKAYQPYFPLKGYFWPYMCCRLRNQPSICGLCFLDLLRSVHIVTMLQMDCDWSNNLSNQTRFPIKGFVFTLHMFSRLRNQLSICGFHFLFLVCSAHVVTITNGAGLIR